MKRYLKLFLNFFRTNVIREMEYRRNFLFQSFVAVCWIFMQIVVLETYFSFTKEIAGWTKPEVFLLLGMFRMVKGTFDTFFRRNLFYLPENISRGDLDYSLTRPVDSLFLISTRYHIFSESASFVIGVIVFVYALIVGTFPINPLFFINFIILYIFATASYYCLFSIFATLSVFTTRLTAITEFNEVLSQTLRYPLDIYARKSNQVSFFLFPLFLVVTLPVKILLRKDPSVYIVVEVFGAVALLFLVRRFWNFALKHYSSASS